MWASRINPHVQTDEALPGKRDVHQPRGGWRNLGVPVCASLEDGGLYITKGVWAKGTVWYPCVMWWNVLSHRSKADSLKTSHGLICQRYKWEQTKSNSPIPTPLCFIFRSLLAWGLWGPLLHASVGDQGKETAYIFSSYLRKGFHTLMWLPGKLPVKTYLHDEVLNYKGQKVMKAQSFPNIPKLVHRCACVIPMERTRN